MKHKITVIKGDGIGPDIINSAIQIMDHAQCNFTYEFVEAGAQALETHKELIPQTTIDAITNNIATLKGPIETPIGTGFTSVNVALRKKFNLYANVRPVKTIAGTKSKYDNVDIITVRENTEGMYSGISQTISEEKATATSIITKQQCVKILNFAYQLAISQKRNKVTIVHKANIMKATSGLFLRQAREISKQYPTIKTEELIVDAACMKLVMEPENFDIIVTTNLFGDIISDLCAGLVGGLGLAAGANIGDNKAIFEAVHGSAPDIANKNIANPTSIILASIEMLKYLDMNNQAKNIYQAIKTVIAEGKHKTTDLGGNASTEEFTAAIINKL